MAFKEVLSLEADRTIAIGGVDKKTKKENPTQAEGYYLGSRTVEGNKYSNGKPSYIYFLQTSKGNLGIWGKTDLDRKMKSVVAGTMIRISYAGMAPTPKGDMHKYKVELDESNTIDVSGIGAPGENDYSNEESEETASSSNGFSAYTDLADEDESNEEYEAPKALPSAKKGDTAARVQDLLNRSKPKAG